MMSCQHSKGSPKPRAYPRVTYPEQHFVGYQDDNCPFRFEYPDFAEIKNKEEKCWF
jgi:hypothetical protein